MDIKQDFEKLFQKIEEERLNNKEQEYNWELPKSMYRVSRVAFNKCKTSRRRKGLAQMLSIYRSGYGEIKTTNKKHHGFVVANMVNGGLMVICDDAKIRFVKESDVVYL